MAKNILITGGAGFVGSHLADALLAAGHHVRIFDNLTGQVHLHGIPEYLAEDAEFIQGDVRDSAAVRRALAGIEVVFHMAAAVGVGQSMYEIEHYMGSNTQGTAVLLQQLLDQQEPRGEAGAGFVHVNLRRRKISLCAMRQRRAAASYRGSAQA